MLLLMGRVCRLANLLSDASLHALEEAKGPDEGADTEVGGSSGGEVELTRKRPACSLTASASLCDTK